MVCFELAGRTLVGTLVSERGSNTVVLVDGINYTVPTSSIRPFKTRKKGS